MEAGSAQFLRGRPFTVADLETMPDDGRRYELIDGTLIASPIPDLPHQTVVGQLSIALDAACPPGMEVVIGPFAVRPSQDTELQPDAVVGRDEDFTEECLPVAPLLAVEVFTSSTRLYDLHTKKAAYQRLGVQHYWVIDPEHPTLTAFELDDAGVYQQVAEVEGAKVFETQQPFPVRIVPVELLGRLAEKD
jgi:Uma2 family endonuclease